MRQPHYQLIDEPSGKVVACLYPGCGTKVLLRELPPDTEGDLQRFVRAHYTKNCPSRQTRYKIGGSALKSLIQMMWEEVDECLDRLVAGDLDPLAAENLKGQLHGMTKLLLIISGPYFVQHDDVKREAMIRLDARKRGVGHHTPGAGNITFSHEGKLVSPQGSAEASAYAAIRAYQGTGNRIADANVKHAELKGDTALADKVRKQTEQANKAAALKKSPPKQPPKAKPAPSAIFTREQVDKIKLQHEQGFEIKMLAMAYKCSEVAIAQVLDVGL